MRTLIFCTTLLAACGSPSGPREPDEYTGCGSDEQWRTFDDQEPQATVLDAMAPVFTSPPSGATVPLSTKPVLTWRQDPNDPGAATGDVPYMNGPGCTMCCPQFNTGALTTAHLPAISGHAYDLQFLIDGVVNHRLVTTLQEWGPSDALWSSWKGKTITIKIYRMTLLHNDVKEGPYAPSLPFSFKVGS